ncbi:MAG TPA: DJ-1/PfpI family protein [Ktedonobacteraceae bacterium]|nr:DJ-1/PfpI family protein [Ktedonobacteraceae bacterium]
MKIAILLYEGMTALDAVGPYDVLSRVPGTQVVFVGKKPGPVHTDSHSLQLSVQRKLSDVPTPDMLLIPGGVLGSIAAARDRQFIDWVRTAHASSQWTASVCSGALLLGAAGLLEGLTATTHWAVQKELARYGATYVGERVVRHGKLFTAAGVSAGIDLALEMVIAIAGVEMAQAIQLFIEYDPHPPVATGALHTAPQSTVTLARRLLRQAALHETGHAVTDTLLKPFQRPIDEPPVEPVL